MTDEEKKAMKYFYNLRATIDESNMLFNEDIDVKCGKETIKQITTIFKLIEKQQKEIEKLKEVKWYYEISRVPKDKIKAKIEVMNTNIVNAEKFDCDYIGQCRFAKYVLQSLLEKE